jgi:hypothetical protein
MLCYTIRGWILHRGVTASCPLCKRAIRPAPTPRFLGTHARDGTRLSARVAPLQVGPDGFLLQGGAGPDRYWGALPAMMAQPAVGADGAQQLGGLPAGMLEMTPMSEANYLEATPMSEVDPHSPSVVGDAVDELPQRPSLHARRSS